MSAAIPSHPDETPPAAGTEPAPASRQAPEPPPEDRYTEAMRRFTGDLRMIRQVWQSMIDRDVALHAGHYQLLLEAHLDGRDLDGARQVLGQMTAAGVPADHRVRWHMALATSRAGRTAEAAAMLDQLRQDGVTPPDELLSQVFSTELAAGRLPAARSLLRQMASRGQSARPAEYRTMLADVLERRAIKDALALVDAMHAGGHAPSAQDVVKVVGMMARAGHTDRAQQMVDTLMERGVTVPTDALNEIVLGWARAGDIDRTRTSLAAVEEAGGTSTSHHHNALLTAVVAAGELEAAWAQAVYLSERAVPTGENLEALIELSVKAKRTDLSLSALDWMLMLGVPAPPHRVADVVGRLISDGQVDVATEIFFETARRGVTPDRRRARDLVEAVVKAGRIDDALKLVAKLRADRILTDGRHYGPVLVALQKAKRSNDAVALLEQMLADKVTPTSADASRLVGGLVRSGELDRACDLIDRLAAVNVGIDEPTYRELLWDYAKKNKVDKAQGVFDRMVATGITPDDRHHKALQWAAGEIVRRLEPSDEAATAPEEPAAPADKSADPTGNAAAPEPADAEPSPPDLTEADAPSVAPAEGATDEAS